MFTAFSQAEDTPERVLDHLARPENIPRHARLIAP